MFVVQYLMNNQSDAYLRTFTFRTDQIFIEFSSNISKKEKKMNIQNTIQDTNECHKHSKLLGRIGHFQNLEGSYLYVRVQTAVSRQS